LFLNSKAGYLFTIAGRGNSLLVSLKQKSARMRWTFTFIFALVPGSETIHYFIGEFAILFVGHIDIYITCECFIHMWFKNLARVSVTMFSSFLTRKMVPARQFCELWNRVPVKFEGRAAESFCLKSKLSQLLHKTTDSFFSIIPDTPHLFCSSVTEKDCTGKKADQPKLEVRFISHNKFRHFAI